MGLTSIFHKISHIEENTVIYVWWYVPFRVKPPSALSSAIQIGVLRLAPLNQVVFAV